MNLKQRIQVWDSKLVDNALRNIEMGIDTDTSCFWGGNLDYRAPDINFILTRDELDEFIKCSNDVVYFAETYAYAMTDEGVTNIKLRPYQEKMLETFDKEQHTIMLCSRQIGKTITSCIFIAWYICFHYDRNVMIVANKQTTAIEIVDKIKVILQNLPFFLKPGIKSGGKLGMEFDNGCRLFSQATTKTAAIGFTIHLLYADEFAHIHNNFIVPFYRSIFPTLSSSEISKIIISSTANGRNLFYTLYKGAVEGTNTYKPFKVDWWEVPGRDDKWKEREIANLGSIELFEQEYGNKFLAGSTMLLSGRVLNYGTRISTMHVWKELYEVNLLPNQYDRLKWHPNFDPNRVWSESDKFVLSIDLGAGVGRDYTVINIFKLETLSQAKIRKVKSFTGEHDFFRLIQVGRFHSNISSIEQTAEILDMLIFSVFDPEMITIILEMNFEGNYLVEKLNKNPEFYEEMFLHSKHSLKAKNESLGVRLNKDNKQVYCRELKNLMEEGRIIITCEDTMEELGSFGLDEKGSYSGQGMHDDLAMSCVNLNTYFDSGNFYEDVEEVIDHVGEHIYKAIYGRIESTEIGNEDIEDIKWLTGLI